MPRGGRPLGKVAPGQAVAPRGWEMLALCCPSRKWPELLCLLFRSLLKKTSCEHQMPRSY